jgi:hypothetical protein
MNNIFSSIESLDWEAITSSMHDKGYAVIPGFLSVDQCQRLIGCYTLNEGYRKKVVMERYRFGCGEYKYWQYPLPNIVQNIREHLYPHLAPIANQWMQVLKLDKQFPSTLEGLIKQCHATGQLKPTALILKYLKGGFNTLHQDLYGEVYFPIQAACFLSRLGEDYEGGEFVLTQQTPRAQSKAIVLTPQQGDMIIFTTHFRPVKGVRGYHRVNMKHGVSEVQSGERHCMGIIFHDALN